MGQAEQHVDALGRGVGEVAGVLIETSLSLSLVLSLSQPLRLETSSASEEVDVSVSEYMVFVEEEGWL